MFRRTTTRRFVAWLALAALWLAAAAPTISRVLPADAWPELGAWCGAHGLDLHHPDAPADPYAHLDKCGYCALLGHSPLIGGAAAAMLPPASLAAAAPAGLAVTAGHVAVPLAAQPRGPPSIRPA